MARYISPWVFVTVVVALSYKDVVGEGALRRTGLSGANVFAVGPIVLGTGR